MRLIIQSSRAGWHPKKWRKAAQAAFNRMIRLKAADRFGFCQCVTCPKRLRWDAAKGLGMDAIDAGHWRPGESVSFIEINCHPQCVRCNQHLSSNSKEYDKFMLKTYGRLAMDMIERLEHQPANNSKEWLCLMQHQFKMACEIELCRLGADA